MTAPEIGTSDGSRTLGAKQELSDPIIAPASFCGNPDDDKIGLDESDDRRGFARLKAELALRGYAILETSHGYLIGRWGWSRIAPDLRACGAFLRQIGGAA